MVSTGVDVKNGGIDDSCVKSHLALQISTSHKGLIDDKVPSKSPDNLAAFPNRPRFYKFGNLASSSLRFHQIADDRDEISRSVPSSSSSLNLRERVNRLFNKKIDWNCLWNMCKEWIRSPFNLALFVWIICVVVSGAILFLVMTGMLNHALPKKSQRDTWFEINNQILNALFTLMCLYQHPKRFYHLVLLLKWRPEDISKLRDIYCKNGTYKPHEWMHMMVVIGLLHINCFAQYALCGLNLGYRRSERPAIGVAITISFAIGAPAAAGLYSMLSPLGRDYDTEFDEELLQVTTAESSKGRQTRRITLEKKFSFVSRDEGVEFVTRPQWSGGILDFWDDISLAYLSLFCSFCVFGWNMERLGFGNMYVHLATFLLFCMAPFWIFTLAAVNINNEAVRSGLAVTGIFLCVFGLLYGGFWRIQMRKRFNLPPYNFCCSKPAVADCALWLCCCWCSLAQEVRTGNSYIIVEDKFCRKQDNDINNLPLSPLPREDRDYRFRSSPSPPAISSSPTQTTKASSPSPTRFSQDYKSPCRHLPFLEEGNNLGTKDETMTPPSHSFVTREDV